MSGPTDAEVALQTLQPLISSNGKIMNTDLLCQLGLFMKGDSIWRRLRLLYAGSEAGFSMGAFETKVLKWQAPTILLVSGTRISDSPETSMEKAFIESLSSRKYPVGDGGDGRVVFGVYLNVGSYQVNDL